MKSAVISVAFLKDRAEEIILLLSVEINNAEMLAAAQTDNIDDTLLHFVQRKNKTKSVNRHL